MFEMLRVAIDGPGGAGKSTVAKMMASRLGIDYVDTGAMYRAVALKMIENCVGLEDTGKLAKLLSETEIDFSEGAILLDGRAVNDLIRTQEISKLASYCSALAPVREKLVALQREIGSKKSVIMDGRDIGTNVLTEAEFKFYMTASKEERARRRHKELTEKGQETTFEIVLEDISMRDHNDMTRKLNPLRKADDAVELDTTEMTIEEVCKFISDRVRGEYDGDNQTI